eukprot:Hpha_TRINITY_DN13038_c0_g1::TRINITY_DN13038_c0_g1_i1::g.68930::m.68930
MQYSHTAPALSPAGAYHADGRYVSPVRVISPARPRPPPGHSPPPLRTAPSHEEFGGGFSHWPGSHFIRLPGFEGGVLSPQGMLAQTGLRKRRPGLRAGMVVASLAIAAVTRALASAAEEDGEAVAEVAALLRSMGISVTPSVARALQSECVFDAQDLLRCSDGDLRELGLKMGERNRVLKYAEDRQGAKGAAEGEDKQEERLRAELSSEIASAEHMQAELEEMRAELRQVAAQGGVTPPPAAPPSGEDAMLQMLREELVQERALCEARVQAAKEDAQRRIAAIDAENTTLRETLQRVEQQATAQRVEAENAERRAETAELELSNALRERDTLQQQLYNAKAGDPDPPPRLPSPAPPAAPLCEDTDGSFSTHDSFMPEFTCSAGASKAAKAVAEEVAAIAAADPAATAESAQEPPPSIATDQLQPNTLQPTDTPGESPPGDLGLRSVGKSTSDLTPHFSMSVTAYSRTDVPAPQSLEQQRSALNVSGNFLSGGVPDQSDVAGLCSSMMRRLSGVNLEEQIPEPSTPLWDSVPAVWAVWRPEQRRWDSFDGTELEKAKAEGSDHARVTVPPSVIALLNPLPVPESAEILMTYSFGLVLFEAGDTMLARYEDTARGELPQSPAAYPPLWLPSAGAIREGAFTEDPMTSFPWPGMIEHLQQLHAQAADGADWRYTPLREKDLSKLVIQCKKAYKGCGLEEAGPVQGDLAVKARELFSRPAEAQPDQLPPELLLGMYEAATGNTGELAPSGVICNALTMTHFVLGDRHFITALECARGALPAIADVTTGRVHSLSRLMRAK